MSPTSARQPRTYAPDVRSAASPDDPLGLGSEAPEVPRSWDADEDAVLLDAIATIRGPQNRPDWSAIAKVVGRNRTTAMCRNRYQRMMAKHDRGSSKRSKRAADNGTGAMNRDPSSGALKRAMTPRALAYDTLGLRAIERPLSNDDLDDKLIKGFDPKDFDDFDQLTDCADEPTTPSTTPEGSVEGMAPGVAPPPAASLPNDLDSVTADPCFGAAPPPLTPSHSFLAAELFPDVGLRSGAMPLCSRVPSMPSSLPLDLDDLFALSHGDLDASPSALDDMLGPDEP